MHDGRSKMERVKFLDNGNGIQSLLNAAYEIWRNPIAIFDTEYCLQAYTEVITDDPLWNELIACGSFSHNTQVLFVEEGFVDAVASAKRTVVLTSDRVKYDRIMGKLYNDDGVHVANLIMVACNNPLEVDDAASFEAVCAVFSKEIASSAFYQTYGNQYQETYIRKLIDGEIEEKGKELFAAHIAIVYYGFASGMRLVVADIGGCDPKYAKLAYFRDMFRQEQDHFEYALYSNYVLVIIDSDGTKFSPRRDLKKLYKIFKKYNIYAGISGCFDNLFDLRRHYTEAVDALHAGRKKGKTQQFFACEASE